MAAEDELSDIKQILAQIRDQNATAAPATASGRDLSQYTAELRMARSELDLLEKGTGAYNRKLKEVESLTKQARNALKDQRRESDALALSMQGLAGAVDMLGNAVDKVIVKFADLISNVMTEAKELDNLTMQFRRSTGASAEMAANIGALSDRLRLFGVSNAEAAAATETLYSNMTIFSQISSTSQATVAATTAIMNELGVSAGTSAQILDNAFRGLNFNAAQSSKLLLDLRGTARALEVPVEQLASDFLTAQNRIIQLGDRGPDAFDKLSAAAKGTGISVEGLLGLTSQFDSFESASKMAAKAAAALGTGVFDVMTGMELREEGPAAQVEYLREQILATGMTADKFQQQNTFRQEMIAKAFNLDTTTMVKLLRGEIDELTESAVEARYTFEEASKEAFGLKGFDAVVTDTMNSLKRPVQQIQEATRATFESFTPLIDKFQDFNKKLIEQTGVFVKENSELVGAVGILYNLAGIDGVQQGYEIFKGIASATGTVLSNVFSIKGVLAALVGGAAYLLRDQIKDIYDILTGSGPGTGPVAAIKATGAALTALFNEYKQKAIDMGFNQEFFDALKEKFKSFALVAYHSFRDNFIKPMFKTLQVEFIYHFERLEEDGTLEKISTTVGNLFGGAVTAAIYAIPGIGPILKGTAGAIDAVGDFAVGLFSDGPEVEDRGRPRTRDEIRKDLSAMTPEQHKAMLAERRNVINARIDDKINTMRLENTKGAQKIVQTSNQVMKKANDAANQMITTVTPYIAKTQQQIDKTLQATQKLAEQGMAEGIKIGREMERANNRAHEEYAKRPVVLVADEREIARLVDPMAKKAVGDTMRGRQ